MCRNHILKVMVTALDIIHCPACDTYSNVPLFLFQVAPQLFSWAWVESVPDPLIIRKPGSARNRTQDLWICSHELWSLCHGGCPQLSTACIKSSHSAAFINAPRLRAPIHNWLPTLLTEVRTLDSRNGDHLPPSSYSSPLNFLKKTPS
jgi:hypothetical protein